jgi:hypothetical protein
MLLDPVDHVVDPGVTSVTFLCSESGGTARLDHLRRIRPNWSGGFGELSLGRWPAALSGLHGPDRLQRRWQPLALSGKPHAAGLAARCPRPWMLQ